VFEVDQDVREFRRFIARNGLVDLGFSGPCVTWCNNRNPPRRVLKRLDRALANDACLLAHPEAMVAVLPRVVSDHSPLIINTIEEGA